MVLLAPCRAVLLLFVHGDVEKSSQLPSAPVRCCCAGTHRVNMNGASQQPSPKNITIPFCSHKPSTPQQPCLFLYSAGVSILEKPRFLLLQGGILIFPSSLVRIFQNTRYQPRSTPVEVSYRPSTTPTVCSPERSQHLGKYAFIFTLLLKKIHSLGFWVFRAFLTVLIARHHFIST